MQIYLQFKSNTMRKILRLCVCLCLLKSTDLFSQQIVFKINTDSSRKPISPFIYGTNQDYDHAGSKRLGGNRLTGYNWENNASNAGTDWINESDDFEISDQGVSPADASTPASVISYFHNKSLNMKAYSLVTLPMAGFVARDMNGTVSASQIAPSIRWASVKLHKQSALSLTPDLTDSFVYLDEELNYLTNKFGKSNTATGIRGYSLDNEPDIWNSTHPLLFGGTGVTVNYLMNQSIQTANLIKDMDPTAEVFGWASYGFNGYLNLQNASDWPAVQGNYGTFLEYYLENMKAEEQKNGRRLLDVLDLHWYPETDLTLNVSPFDDKTDYTSNQLRMNMVRSLWDSSYTENTWINRDYHDLIFPLLPKLNQYIGQHYPNTKLAISEYSYMGMNHVSGGIAQADALGTFGNLGLYLATYWGYVQKYIKCGFDLYRNYDGKGSTFVDINVNAVSNNNLITSVYASAESADSGKLHIVALNKDQDSARLITISVSGQTKYNSAFVYMFDNTTSQVRRLNNIRRIDSNSFQITMPAMSAFHFILTTEDLSVYPYIDSLKQNITAAYADGKSILHIEASISDGDNNIKNVMIDLSSLGADSLHPFIQNGNKYTMDYTLQKGITPGLKSLHFTVNDSTGHVVVADVAFRIIAVAPPFKLWDGDIVKGGSAYKFYDDADSHIAQMKMNVLTTGGNQGPANLHLYMIHDPYKWNLFSWRFAPNPFQVDDVSNYNYLEFYIKSNAPAGSDIDISIQDASTNQNNSASISLKGNGYISSFSPTSYTRVRIPFDQFKGGVNFDLTKLWQINFHSNTATKGFDVWVDDITAVPYSLPSATPVFNAVSISPKGGYADGSSAFTLTAKASDPDNNLKGVYADLSPVGGKNNQQLIFDGQSFKTTYMVPSSIVKGPKNILVYAIDSTGNEKDTLLNYTIYQKSTTDTIWNGDKIKFGSAWVSNANTTCALRSSGGYFGPGVLKSHLQVDNVDNWAGISWSWNDAANHNIQDLSDKRYLSFYLKIANAPKTFDLELMLKDINTNQSQSVYLKGGNYISSYSGQYQKVTVPLSDLFNQAQIDRTNVTNFILTSASLPLSGLDVYIDDITASGSMLADVRISEVDASCANNGIIKVDSIVSSPHNYTYLINGTINPSGSSNPVFSNLSPGLYNIKIIGDSTFVFLQSMTVRGKGPLLVTSVIVNSNGINTTVTGGSGRYGFLWSGGQTTANLTGLAPGTYSLSVSDSVSGCKGSSTVTIPATMLVKSRLLEDDITKELPLKLYPNPAHDKLILTNHFKNVAKTEFYNISGQLIKVDNQNSSHIEYDVSNFLGGQYTIKIYYENDVYATTFIKL